MKTGNYSASPFRENKINDLTVVSNSPQHVLAMFRATNFRRYFRWNAVHCPLLESGRVKKFNTKNAL